MEIRLIYITTKNADEARAIARALVEERLAACANIVGSIESLYWWQGSIEHDHEALVIAKTRADLVDALVAKVKSLHSYTVPCVAAIPVVAGNPDYLRWLRSETATS